VTKSGNPVGMEYRQKTHSRFSLKSRKEFNELRMHDAAIGGDKKSRSDETSVENHIGLSLNPIN
jgi:hypothetical protein